MHASFRSVALLALGLTVTFGATPTSASDFATGDLYLGSTAVPVPPNQFARGIMRIEPLTGSVSTLLFMPDSDPAAMTYDPFRDRLVLPGAPGSLDLVAVDGGVTTLTYSAAAWAPSDVATAGDGRLYLVVGVPTVQVRYLDASDTSGVLMEADGVTPFSLPVASSTCLFVDAPGNALVLALSHGATSIQLRRIPLSADGTRVVGPITTGAVNASPTKQAETPIGLSAGPNGTMVLQIQLSVADGPRAWTINPQTLAAAAFAPAVHTYATSERAGAYSAARSQMVVLETFEDVLRAFNPGEPGGGVAFASGVSPAFSCCEAARLIAIGGTVGGATPPHPADLNGDGAVGPADLAILLSQWGPCAGCAADLDGDGDVDAADLAILLGAWS